MMKKIVVGGLAVAASACSGGSAMAPSTLPSIGLATGQVTEAFEYRYAPDDSVNVSWQEAYHRWAVEALQVAPPRRIRYNKYKSREHMGSVIGVGNTNGFANAETFEFHTIWPIDNHEVVHLYSAAFGRTVALWSEGLAVAFQTNPQGGDLSPHWSGVLLDDWVRRFHAEGRLIAISDLLTTADFRRFDDSVTYPEAGSFTRFVIDTCGLQGMKQMFGAVATGASADIVRMQFQAICGRSIEAAEQAWLTALDVR